MHLDILFFVLVLTPAAIAGIYTLAAVLVTVADFVNRDREN